MIEAQLQYFMRISYSEIREMKYYDLVREYAKMKWVLNEQAKSYKNL